MWPNLFTESWAGALFQTVVVLLVFALGVPALVLQIGMPADLQRVAGRGLRNIRLTGLLMIFYILIACAFVWVLHPTSGSISSGDTLSASLVLTGTLIVTVLFWWHQALENRRERIIQRLQFRLGHGAQHTGLISDERALEDLVYLGVNGHHGYEKQLCLGALARVATSVQSSSLYGGSSLDSVILGLEEIVISDESGARDRDLQMCCGIVRRISESARARPSPTDAAAALRGLGRVGRLAAARYSEATAMMFTQAVSFSSRELSRLGIEAAKHGRYLIALDALSRIERLAALPSKTPDDRYLAGLCAHMWGSRKSLRTRVQQSLQIHLSFGEKNDWRSEIASLIDEYRRVADYETADLLEVMVAELHVYAAT